MTLTGRRGLLPGVVPVLLAVLAPHAQAAPAATVVGTQRVSVNTAGVQANFSSQQPLLSADARFVAFQSKATNLDPRCPPRFPLLAVYVRDLVAGRTECVSQDDAGRGAVATGISANGRYITYATAATSDLNDFRLDNYVWDRQSRTRRQLNVDAAGRRLDTSPVTLSADGRVAAFHVIGLTNPDRRDQLIVRDLAIGRTETITGSLNGDGQAPPLSADGRYVFYQNRSGLLTRFDRVTRTTRYAGPSIAELENPSVSADGSRVAFFGQPPYLPSDTNKLRDIYVGTITGNGYRLQRITQGVDGGEPNGESRTPALSPDGNYVLFYSDASNLIANDTNGVGDVFAHNLSTGVTWLVGRGRGTRPSDGNRAGLGAGSVTTSASGRAVMAYTLTDGVLVPGDTNQALDVFVTSLG